MIRWALASLLALSLVACGDSGPEVSPTVSALRTARADRTAEARSTVVAVETKYAAVTPAVLPSLCPSDTSTQLDTYAANAARSIKERSGKTIQASKIRADVLSVIPTSWPNGYPGSCAELFALYVITEAP